MVILISMEQCLKLLILITSISHYHDNQSGNPIKDDCRFEFIWMEGA